MDIAEIDGLALDLFGLLDANPVQPPGPFRLAVLAWGPGALRYVPEPRPDPVLQPHCGGWVLELPPRTQSNGMTLGIAIALARWIARRNGVELDAEDELFLALAIVMPLPAVNHVTRRGLTAIEIARLFGVDPTLVSTRFVRMLPHGSGERPSATLRAVAKKA